MCLCVNVHIPSACCAQWYLYCSFLPVIGGSQTELLPCMYDRPIHISHMLLQASILHCGQDPRLLQLEISQAYAWHKLCFMPRHNMLCHFLNVIWVLDEMNELIGWCVLKPIQDATLSFYILTIVTDGYFCPLKWGCTVPIWETTFYSHALSGWL